MRPVVSILRSLTQSFLLHLTTISFFSLDDPIKIMFILIYSIVLDLQVPLHRHPFPIAVQAHHVPMRIKLPCFTVFHGSCPGSPRLGRFEPSICPSSECITSSRMRSLMVSPGTGFEPHQNLNCCSTWSHVLLDLWVDEGEIHQQPGGIGNWPGQLHRSFGERFGTEK